MVRTVTSFASRRWRGLTLTAVAAVLLSAGLGALSSVRGDSSFVSGWLLLGALAFLAAYNLRKKAPYPPLVRSSTWLQLHLYVGLLSVLLFGLHAGLRLPAGPLEILLALLYVSVAATGVLGLVLSRVIPPALVARGEEVIFERIPAFRRELRERAEGIVLDCARTAEHPTLGDFYRERLADFFDGPRNRWRHLAQSRRHLRRLTGDLRSLLRFLGPGERDAVGELVKLVEAKDSLDYHHALQGALKLWLFLHIPLTYALLVAVLAHVLLVHAFFAGLR